MSTDMSNLYVSHVVAYMEGRELVRQRCSSPKLVESGLEVMVRTGNVVPVRWVSLVVYHPHLISVMELER